MGNPTLLQVSRGTRACAVKPLNSCEAVLPDCARLRSTTLPSRDGATVGTSLGTLTNPGLTTLRCKHGREPCPCFNFSHSSFKALATSSVLSASGRACGALPPRPAIVNFANHKLPTRAVSVGAPCAMAFVATLVPALQLLTLEFVLGISYLLVSCRLRVVLWRSAASFCHRQFR